MADSSTTSPPLFLGSAGERRAIHLGSLLNQDPKRLPLASPFWLLIVSR